LLSGQGPLVVTTTKSSRNHTARSDFLLLFCFLRKDEFVFKTRRKERKKERKEQKKLYNPTNSNQLT